VPEDADLTVWSLQHDNAKTLITLGTAVLGVSITFGKDFLAPNGSVSKTLWWAWLAIAISILSAFLASATVFNLVKFNANPDASQKPEDQKSQRKKPERKAIFLLNASFYLLFGGLAVLAFTVHSNWSSAPIVPKTQSIATDEKAVAVALGIPQSELYVTQFDTLDSTRASLVVVDRRASSTFVAIIDTSDGQIVDLNNVHRCAWRKCPLLPRSGGSTGCHAFFRSLVACL